VPKKVLLVIIDALTPGVLLPAIAEGRLPTFAALVERGEVNPECCSIFPSITHACLSSIATGTYPTKHGIVGSFWYDQDSKELAYYGAQFWVILNQGIDKFLEDLLGKMNMERLRAPTIFEEVEDAGLRAACLNLLIFRGRHTRNVREPFLLRPLPVVTTNRTIKGPSTHMLGDFVPLEIDGKRVSTPVGIRNRFGMNDVSTLGGLKALAEHNAFPDFTVAYFPDNDIESHACGPHGAVSALEKLDAGLAEIFEAMGGIDRVLEEFAILIHGDHAQTDVLPGETRGGILVNELLKEFRVLHAGDVLDAPHEILVAPNLRTAFLYFSEPTIGTRDRVAHLLLADPRIDQVLWHDDVFEGGQKGFTVQTRDRGCLRFWLAGEGDEAAYDEYGCAWAWDGDLRAVDASVEGRLIKWGDYPNAFERIACGIGPVHAGHLWTTAKLGYGFRLPEIKAHSGGGSHASLHKGDSFTALIGAGLPEGIRLPDRPRIVDTAPLIKRILGMESKGLGQARCLPS